MKKFYQNKKSYCRLIILSGLLTIKMGTANACSGAWCDATLNVDCDGATGSSGSGGACCYLSQYTNGCGYPQEEYSNTPMTGSPSGDVTPSAVAHTTIFPDSTYTYKVGCPAGYVAGNVAYFHEGAVSGSDFSSDCNGMTPNCSVTVTNFSATDTGGVGINSYTCAVND